METLPSIAVSRSRTSDLAHLHGQDRATGVLRHVHADGQAQRRLAHGGRAPTITSSPGRRPPSRYSSRSVRPVGHAVTSPGAGARAVRSAPPSRRRRLDPVVARCAFVPFADGHDSLLRGVDQGLGRALRVEPGGGDLVASRHQLAQDRLLAHDLGVAAHVARAGHVLRERVQVRQAARLPRPCRPRCRTPSPRPRPCRRGSASPAQRRSARCSGGRSRLRQQVADAVERMPLSCSSAPSTLLLGLERVRRDACELGVQKHGPRALMRPPCFRSCPGRPWRSSRPSSAIAGCR
jgi:hypothetical protein